MFLLEWYKEWLEIRADYKSRKTELTREVKQVEICESCETLKEQLALANAREQKLLERIMEKPEPIKNEAPLMNTKPLINRHTPWRVRQQMLQAEDREKARIMREAPQPDTDVAELEKELDIASAERSAEAATKS